MEQNNQLPTQATLKNVIPKLNFTPPTSVNPIKIHAFMETPKFHPILNVLHNSLVMLHLLHGFNNNKISKKIMKYLNRILQQNILSRQIPNLQKIHPYHGQTVILRMMMMNLKRKLLILTWMWENRYIVIAIPLTRRKRKINKALY